MFEKATRLKLHFKSNKGSINLYDLWEMPLTNRSGFDLDSLARSVSKELKETESESFVETKEPIDNGNKLRLDILKHIIKYKMDMAESNKNRQETKARNEQIARLIQDKTNENLANLSIDELKRMMSGS